MPRVKKLDLGMTALDELFMNDKERAENKLPKIFDIPLSEIDDFPGHPYRVLDDEDMQNLTTAAVTKSSIGGADIKLSAACAFMLGTVQGMTGLMIGLILAVIVNSIKNRKKKHEGFPLIPYLAVGFTAAYFKAKIDRIFERLGLVPESVADVHPEKTKEKDAPERTAPDKSEADKFLDEVMAKTNPTKEEPHTINPTEARTEKQNQSVPSSKSNRDSKDRSADARTAEERRPSVRKELKEIREEMDREKKPKGKTKNSPTKTAEHKAPAKKKKSKER